MIVSLNGLTINDPATGNGIYLDEPLDGLALPPIRTSSGNYSGRDGGWVGAQFYGARLISLTGRVFSASTASLEASRRTLQSYIAKPSVAMQITTNGGSRYAITCNLDSFTMPIGRAAVSAPFQITLVAPDPIIYDNSSGSMNSAAISRTFGGGLVWPITWPVTWSGGSLPTTITNSGEVTVYPTVLLTNVMTSPVLSNTTTGGFISLPTFTTAPGDVLTIDMKNRTVLLNGGSVYSYVSASSTFWPLVPGSNSISLTTGSGSDTVAGTVAWRSGYRGI